MSGNPAGKPRNLLTKDKVASTISKIAHLEKDEAKEVRANPKSTMLEATIAAIFIVAEEKADSSRMTFLMERSIGKAREEEVTTDDVAELFSRMKPEEIASYMRARLEKTNASET